MMRVYFESIDWYHCNIYQIRFLFFKRLIAHATLDCDDRISFKIMARLVISDNLILRTYQYMIWYRENSKKKPP